MATAESALERQWSGTAAASNVARRVREVFTTIAIRRAKILTEWLIRALDPTGNATFFDTREFPWIAGIESEWEHIRSELDAVLAGERIPSFSDLSPMQAQVVQGKDWRSFFLHVTGERHSSNVALCPNTTRLLETIPGLETSFFSILEPGTRLSPHRGPFGGVLRYHLALKVPEPAEACGIRVGRDVAHWRERRSLVFDDSHDHEAWNDSDQCRVVLFVDFERPLWGPLRFLNRAMLRLVARAAFMEQIRVNLRSIGGSQQCRASRA